MIGALVLKDFKLFFRNKFFAIITVLGLVTYAALYFLLPTEVEESFAVAMYFEDPAATFVDDQFSEYFDYALFDTESEMISALEDGDVYLMGISISSEQAQAISMGQKAVIDAYYAPNIPTEIRSVYDDMLMVVVNGANPTLAAQFGRINETSEVLGDDLAGAEIPLRDRIVPLLFLFILAVEVMGLGTLIMQEVEVGTARAILTTPLHISQFFTSKAIMGMTLSFGQLAFLMLLTQSISDKPLLMIVTLLAGCFMITGFGFLIAAISKDNMSVLAWGMLVVIVFSIPSFSVMLPGLATGWAEVIPSHFLVDSLHRILNFGADWADVSGNVLILLVTGLVTLGLSTIVLRRKFL